LAARGQGCGGILLGVGIVSGVLLFLGGVFAFTTLVLAHSRPLPGDSARFDPVAAFPAIQAEAGEGARLVRLEATFVRADGTLDLTARYLPSPGVEYRFARPVPAPANAPPLGAGRQPGDAWFVPVAVSASRPWQWHSVSRSSGGVRTRYQYVNLGLSLRERDAESGRLESAPPPACSFAGLWKAARERGAPGDAVATIRYDASGYRFEIRGTAVSLRFGLDCRLPDPSRRER
jgi:hypothetical protein